MTPQERLARIQIEKIETDISHLDPWQQEALELLAQTADPIDEIYLKQMHRSNLRLKDELSKRTDEEGKALFKLFQINGGPFDRRDNNTPFIEGHIWHPGANFYPPGATKEEVERYLERWPEDRKLPFNHYTAVREIGVGLASIPYNWAYKVEVNEIAELLIQVAKISQNASLTKYCRQKAIDLRRDEYFDSTCAWIDLDEPYIDFVIGPEETYDDHLMGMKSSYELILVLKNPDAPETAGLDFLQKNVQLFENSLPIEEKFKSKHEGLTTKFVVGDEIWSAGEMRSGIVAIAFNLPNDPKIKNKKGNKIVFLKNMMEFKKKQRLPVYAEVLPAYIVDELAQSKVGFWWIAGHELAHGLGPRFVQGTEKYVKEALQDIYSPLEESKADMLGYWILMTCAKENLYNELIFPAELFAYQQVALVFRFQPEQIKESAHGKGVIMHFNYFQEQGAIIYDSDDKRYFVDIEKWKRALENYCNIVLMFQANGDYKGAKEFLDHYSKPDATTLKTMERVKGLNLPIDLFIEEFSFKK